jgi:hypothetical protein
LDGTDFRIYEQTPFDRKWYSHKFKGPGLRYEVGLSIINGNIVWAYGGMPCGEYPDLVLARDLYLDTIDLGEMTMADDGYNDRNYFITGAYFPQRAEEIKRIMARHETVNRRLKQFKVLGDRFRHNVHLHPRCFYAVVNIIATSFLTGERLYDL